MDKTIRTAGVVLVAIILLIGVVIAAPGVDSTVAPVSATTAPASGPGVTPGSPAIEVLYFYGDTCSHCEKIKPLLASLEEKYPGMKLTRLEVYNNAKNRDQLASLSRKYSIENPGVPILFIGNTFLLGDVEITDRFETEILAEQQRLATSSPANPLSTLWGQSGTVTTAALSLPLVVGAALVDSTNPCGLSVLVFLLITMTAAGGRKRILLVGGAYIAAMFLFHLLVGIGLFSLFSLSGLAKAFSIIGGAIALILGVITIADVLRNKETFILSIPKSRKGLLGTYARKASLPAAFLLGILAGILGFTCTGGIYISILGLMGKEMTMMAGLPWLILYNLVYVLPLIIITLLVAYGLSPERAEKLQGTYKRQLRLLIGLILIALGAVILLGWFG